MRHSVIVFSVMLAALLVGGSSWAASMQFSVHFNETDLTFEKRGSFDLIQLDGCEVAGELGEPALPRKLTRIAIPRGYRVSSVKVVSFDATVLDGEYRIVPVQPEVPVSSSSRADWAEPDPAVYGRSTPFPEVIAVLKSQGSMSGNWLAGIEISPVRYIPADGKVILCTRIQFELELELEPGSGGLPVRARSPVSEKLVQDAVRSVVLNPEGVRPTVAEDSPLLWPDDTEYLIITGTPLMDRFQEVADWKTLKGVPAEVVGVEWIYANYAGVDNAEKVRNCITDYYQNKGLIWVLLGGDVNVVPYRGCYGRVGGTIDNSMPCDLYYSDLDGDFNGDGDNIWGEVTDGVDLYPDVYVGRLPVASFYECSLAIRKAMIYEGVHDVTPLSCDYQLKMLFLAEWLDASTDAGLGKNIIDNAYVPSRYDPISKLYESLGNLDKQVAVDSMNTGYAIVNHSGHSNYGVMSVGPNSLNRADMYNLTNDARFTVCYSIGCIAGGFEDNDCIGENFVLAPSGGGYFVGNSRYGWYSPGNPGGGTSERYDQVFFGCLFDGANARLGMAQAVAKTYYIAWSYNYGASRWCQFCLNLLGEPESFVWTDIPDTLEPVYESVVGTKNGAFDVTVLADGQPVASALVCLMKDDEVYLRDFTNSSGQVSFSLPDMTPGVLKVTATGHNYIPHRGQADVIEGPEIPAYILPGNGSVFGNRTPTCVWSATAGPAGTYTLEYSDREDFSLGVVTVPGLTDTAYTVLDADSLSDACYFWRVQAVDVNGFPSGYESDAWCFVVDNTPPEISDTYQWPDTTYRGPYFVETVVQDLSGILGAYLAYRTDADTVWRFREMELLAPQGVYYRHIPEQSCGVAIEYYVYAADLSDPANTACDPAGAPDEVYSFTVLELTGLELVNQPVTPASVFLNASPNPGRSVVSIGYGVPQPSKVSLVIFDSSGRGVRTICDGTHAAGVYNLTWDGRDSNGDAAPSGIYYARLVCGGESRVTKIAMVR